MSSFTYGTFGAFAWFDKFDFARVALMPIAAMRRLISWALNHVQRAVLIYEAHF
jgi:hypothetical protein